MLEAGYTSQCRCITVFVVASVSFPIRAYSSVVEHLPYKQGVTGSNPVAPTSRNDSE